MHYRPRKERDRYPNLIYSTWETVDRPRQVIVSDMTMIKGALWVFEVTFYFDVFTKEMLTYRVGVRRGDRTQYLDGLEDIIRIDMMGSRQIRLRYFTLTKEASMLQWLTMT